MIFFPLFLKFPIFDGGVPGAGARRDENSTFSVKAAADTIILSELGVFPPILTCRLGVPPLFLAKMLSFRQKPHKKSQI